MVTPNNYITPEERDTLDLYLKAVDEHTRREGRTNSIDQMMTTVINITLRVTTDLTQSAAHFQKLAADLEKAVETFNQMTNPEQKS